MTGPLLLSYRDHAPQVDPAAWVAPNATLVGQVGVAAEASIFYGAVARGDMAAIEIGARSNVQDNAVVHTDTGFPAIIGSGVSIGHAAVVHGCTLADETLIGMNATVLNGAVIGRHSLVAAGTVVLEGTVVPPGSLVAGVPGTVRRALTSEEITKVIGNAEHYLELAAGHRHH